MPHAYLAIDVGGGSGRGIIGTLDGKRLTLREIRRFENSYLPIAGRNYWNTLQLFREMILCVKTAAEQEPELSSFCADLWGGDFAFIDHNGQPIGYSWCTRNADGSAVDAFFRNIMPAREYVRQSGSQIRRGNAPFQLYERMLEKDAALEGAARFLMLPDYFGYLFTGEAYNEFTVATTSQLISPQTGTWNQEMIRALGLPDTMFGRIIMPGTVRFDVRQDVLPGIQAKYAPAATHDTASAVTCLQIAPDEVFSSSGTWTIIGTECDGPTVNDMVYRYSFSNEGTIDGRWRLQKDIMGMWCVQNLFRKYQKKQPDLTWEDVVCQASKAEPLRSLVNLSEPAFTSDTDPEQLIRAYCEKTDQPVPEGLGAIARCVYESMALQYGQTIRELKDLTGRPFRRLRIVGGGGKNGFLNQMIADVSQMHVTVGPYEAASTGNILMQAVAEGIVTPEDFPEIVETSFETVSYQPDEEKAASWEAAGRRLAAYSRTQQL